MSKPSILTTLSDEKIAAQFPLMSNQAMAWLRDKVSGLSEPYRMAQAIAKEKGRYTKPQDSGRFLMGGMYFFAYDPKLKRELPYYDRFPLVIPLKAESDGFLGLNLHYLPMRYRINFMKKLLPLALYDGDDIRRIQITYAMLAATSRYREFRPCIKKYLYPHVTSRILKVEPYEWDTAIFLPVHQFKKASADTVWQESVEQIKAS
jgi:hypothetical protein